MASLLASFIHCSSGPRAYVGSLASAQKFAFVGDAPPIAPPLAEFRSSRPPARHPRDLMRAYQRHRPAVLIAPLRLPKCIAGEGRFERSVPLTADFGVAAWM